ncbi:MAG: GDSL-type esterase/lipase family protein [Roseburia sp.]|nr:GDSL-type esterase/lipase family protein [Roseburia sp.]MCM1099661.1 GDSL-type esterase/lipase family protein [Ruminococcus flavefaciens]
MRRYWTGEQEGGMRFLATEDQVRVTGRTLFAGGVRYLGFSGSSVSFCFTGKKAVASIWSNAEDGGEGGALLGRIAVYLQGEDEPIRRICLDREEGVYTLYESDRERRVTLTIVKYSEAAFGKCGIRYLEIDTDRLWTPPAHKARRLEIIGDSITCGYGVEAENELQPFHTATENPTKSYSLLTAEALDAEASLISWSGNGIISGYVDETAERPSDGCLMPRIYPYTDLSCSEKLFGDREEKWERWDFGRFALDVILVNLGTNDCSWCRDIPERKAYYREKYIEFLKEIRGHNPSAQILCMLGTMDQRLLGETEEAVRRFAAAQKDSAVRFLALPPQDPSDGYGADWHPSPLTQRKTAEIVTAEVRRMTGWSSC